MKIISTIEGLRSHSCTEKTGASWFRRWAPCMLDMFRLFGWREKTLAPDGEVAVSIFVNPLQFEPGSDFSRYPRPESADEEICREEGVNLIFRPLPDEMYFDDRSTLRRRNRAFREALRGVAAGTFPRRLHCGGKVVSSPRAGRRGFWGKGFSATGDHPANGARSDFPIEIIAGADGARSGRACAQLTQSIPQRGRASSGADHSIGRCWSAAAVEGRTFRRQIARSAAAKDRVGDARPD